MCLYGYVVLPFVCAGVCVWGCLEFELLVRIEEVDIFFKCFEILVYDMSLFAYLF